MHTNNYSDFNPHTFLEQQETFGERLCRLRTERGIPQTTLSVRLRLSRNAVSNWETGRTRPDISKIPELCAALQISPSVLFGVAEENERRALEDQDLLFQFHSLNEQNQKIVRQMIVMLNDMQAEDKTQVRLVDIKRVYFNSERASAGTGNMLCDSLGEYVYVHIPRNKHRKVDEIITVTGNSMEPTYSNGDNLLVEHTGSINEGEIGIFIVDGQGFVKEYHQDGLHSHNPEYPTIRFSDGADVKCIGRVLGVLTKEQYATQEEIALMEERKQTRRPRRKS